MFKPIIAALLIAGGLPAAAAAQPSATVRVAYHDLNLSSPQGLKAFDRRISHAVGLVCPRGNDTSVRAVIDVAQCRSYAHARAADQRSQLLAATVPSAPIAAAR